jgi:methylase of polypeptide subunit release factors
VSEQIDTSPKKVGGKRALRAHIWEREVNEHYVEPAWCSSRLFEDEGFDGAVFDPCCGFGTIVIEALKHGLSAAGSDLVDRGWEGMRAPRDFLAPEGERYENIVCNPPFNIAPEFARAALARTERKVAMIFPTARLNAAHKWLRVTPLRRVWLMTPRPSLPPGHTITAGEKPGRGKMDFCWLLWEQGYQGEAAFNWLRRDGDLTKGTRS